MFRIKDIAIEANVSEGTVDRVLHNRGGVSKKTEDKVKEILKKRNFIKNPVASALAKQIKANIAVLIPSFNSIDSFWESPFNGIQKAVAEVNNIGIAVDYYEFDQLKPNSYVKSFEKLIKTKPSAILLVPLFKEETKIIMKKIQELKIACFFLNIETNGFKNTCFIGQDAFTAGNIAGKLMSLSISKHADILIINTKGKTENNTIVSRIDGFKSYFEEKKLENKLVTIDIDNFKDTLLNKKIIDNYISKNNLIKGIFVPSSRISSVVNYLSEKQLSEVKLIGFDNTKQNIALLKSDVIFFLISQKPFEQGYEAIRLIADRLKGNNNQLEKIYLPIDILTKENVVYHDMNQDLFEDKIEID